MTDSAALGVPHRRLRLTLDLEADDLGEMVNAIYDLAEKVGAGEDGEAQGGTRGGTRSGWHYSLVVTDPDMTPERYREALTEWVEVRRASR